MTPAAFRRIVLGHFSRHGRNLPWRRTHDPYRILVSEVMLQQTQVDRCMQKYREFVRAFPNVHALARASVRDVLAIWSGLGYNRRAMHVHHAAQVIMEKHQGRVPAQLDALDALPGIGRYTAGAVLAFAFNIPAVCIETNIRSVYLHHFFPNRTEVSDQVLAPVVEQTMDKKNPRVWYWALMDYGAMLKKKVINPSRRSKHYTKQSRFQGSLRQARGAVLRALVSSKNSTPRALFSRAGVDRTRFIRALTSLEHDGLIIRGKGSILIA